MTTLQPLMQSISDQHYVACQDVDNCKISQQGGVMVFAPNVRHGAILSNLATIGNLETQLQDLVNLPFATCMTMLKILRHAEGAQCSSRRPKV